MSKIITMLMCLLLWGGQALAFCNAAVTASTPTADFLDHGDGTVTHSKTGLMWKRCSEGEIWDGINSACIGTVAGSPWLAPTEAASYTWQGALQQVQSLNAGGGFATFTDWRVPNVKELSSIVESQCWADAVNTVIFPGTTAIAWYWSASPDASSASNAWIIDFGTGYVTVYGKANNYPLVRAVRGGL